MKVYYGRTKNAIAIRYTKYHEVYPIKHSTIGNNLNSLEDIGYIEPMRKRLFGLRILDIAEILECSIKTVQNRIKGDTPFMYNEVVKICNLLDISANDFMDELGRIRKERGIEV